MLKKIQFFFLWSISFAHGDEACLSDVRQVTFSSMGFEREGEAYFSPDGNSIIFQAVPTGKKYYQMYTMDLQEGIPKCVSTGIGACTCGFYRPDGEKILFASSHENGDHESSLTSRSYYSWELTPYMNLYEANLDGTSLHKVTSGPAYHAECAYSPDGKQIVYASNESGSMNLYVCNTDGSHARRLTWTEESYNGGPFFSPDGEWIVFRSDREEKDLLQIFIVKSDGSEERQLTNNRYVNWAPFWHPNGKIIAYTTSKHGHKAYQIYLMNIETFQEFRLTESQTFEGLPSFSPDGRKIAWTSKRGDGTCHIFIANFHLPEDL